MAFRNMSLQPEGGECSVRMCWRKWGEVCACGRSCHQAVMGQRQLRMWGAKHGSKYGSKQQLRQAPPPKTSLQFLARNKNTHTNEPNRATAGRAASPHLGSICKSPHTALKHAVGRTSFIKHTQGNTLAV